jgi:hypothetical protein
MDVQLKPKPLPEQLNTVIKGKPPDNMLENPKQQPPQHLTQARLQRDVNPLVWFK